MRVLPPIAILPQGDTDTTADRGSPFTTAMRVIRGFMTEPLTVGLMPSHLERPALPRVMFSCSRLPIWLW